MLELELVTQFADKYHLVMVGSILLGIILIWSMLRHKQR